MKKEDSKNKVYRQLKAVRNSIDFTLRDDLTERLHEQLIRTQQSVQAAMNAITADRKEDENSEA